MSAWGLGSVITCGKHAVIFLYDILKIELQRQAHDFPINAWMSHARAVINTTLPSMATERIDNAREWREHIVAPKRETLLTIKNLRAVRKACSGGQPMKSHSVCVAHVRRTAMQKFEPLAEEFLRKVSCWWVHGCPQGANPCLTVNVQKTKGSGAWARDSGITVDTSGRMALNPKRGKMWYEAITEMMGAVIVVFVITGGRLTVHPQKQLSRETKKKTPTDPKASTRTIRSPFFWSSNDWEYPGLNVSERESQPRTMAPPFHKTSPQKQAGRVLPTATSIPRSRLPRRKTAPPAPSWAKPSPAHHCAPKVFFWDESETSNQGASNNSRLAPKCPSRVADKSSIRAMFRIITNIDMTSHWGVTKPKVKEF